MASGGLAETSQDKICSDRFNDETADVAFISSDGVLFRIHSVFLRAHTEALAPEHGSPLKDPAQLTESSAILNLLFDFIHPDNEPVVELKVEFDILLGLSEAAAKYQVFPACYVCNQQLRTVLPNHAFEILAYAHQHGLHGLLNAASTCALDLDPADVDESVPEQLYRSWMKFRQQWTRIRKKALTDYLPPNNVSSSAIRPIVEKLSSLASLDAIPAVRSSHYSAWKNAIAKEVAQIPKFTEFIGWKDLESTEETPSIVMKQDQSPVVIIETSDGAKHHIALDILRACSHNFGDPSEDGKIMVPESSSTIDLLLRFIKPVQSPDPKGLNFTEFNCLSLAAEKYSIRQAKGLCRLRMIEEIQNHPHEVFYYAAEACHPDITDLTAPLVLGTIDSFSDVIRRLPAKYAIAWNGGRQALYYQQWQNGVRIYVEAVSALCVQSYPTGMCICGTFERRHLFPLLSILMNTPGELANLESALGKQVQCSQSTYIFNTRESLAKATLKDIKPMSSFL